MSGSISTTTQSAPNTHFKTISATPLNRRPLHTSDSIRNTTQSAPIAHFRQYLQHHSIGAHCTLQIVFATPLNRRPLHNSDSIRNTTQSAPSAHSRHYSQHHSIGAQCTLQTLFATPLNRRPVHTPDIIRNNTHSVGNAYVRQYWSHSSPARIARGKNWYLWTRTLGVRLRKIKVCSATQNKCQTCPDCLQCEVKLASAVDVKNKCHTEYNPAHFSSRTGQRRSSCHFQSTLL